MEVGLVDVWGGKMWYVCGEYFWTKKETEKHIRDCYNDDKKRQLLNMLKNCHGRSYIYGLK